MRWYIEGLSEIDDTNERFRLLTIWKKETGEGEEASEEMKERIRRKASLTHIPTASPICYTADSPYVSCEKRRREKEAGKGGEMSLTDPLFKKRKREREAGKGGSCLSLPIRPICHTQSFHRSAISSRLPPIVSSPAQHSSTSTAGWQRRRARMVL